MFSAGLRTAKNASPYLRRVLHGATTDWMCVHLTPAWARLRTMIMAEKRPKWPSKPHTGLHMIQEDLHKLG